jgi:hypothetical protein
MILPTWMRVRTRQIRVYFTIVTTTPGADEMRKITFGVRRIWRVQVTRLNNEYDTCAHA